MCVCVFVWLCFSLETTGESSSDEDNSSVSSLLLSSADFVEILGEC